MTEVSELSDFINDIVKNFNDKIKEIYDKKLLEHQYNISYNLSDGYTENYGKINEKDIISIQNYMLSINKNRYIIHNIYIYASTGFNIHHTTTCYRMIIDNYGDYLYFSWDANKDNYHYSNPHRYIGVLSNYILPNYLIDVIKEFSNLSTLGDSGYDIYSKPLSKIKILTKDYYQRFTKYKSLYQLGKLTDYDKLLEQIETNNNIHLNDMEKINKDITEKDILIKSLKEENDELNNIIINDKEKIKLTTENESYIDEIKSLKDELKKLKTSNDKLNITINIINDENNKLKQLNKKYRKTIIDFNTKSAKYSSEEESND